MNREYALKLNKWQFAMGAIKIKRISYFLIFGMILSLVIAGRLPSAVTVASGNKPRPKIGIALGGGSALGFMHIGVLRWLEENRIPVDYVAGTSMGGLIGGLYAMGMSPDEIETLVKQVDWAQIFNSVPPYNTLNFRRKEDQRDYSSEIQLGHKDGIFVPNGLAVYQVYFLLSRLTLPYSTVASFDELPISYRCVAADIRNCETVVLQNGSLAEAMRATMSIPGVFVPVEREGRLLVDGMILDNVPADVAKSMGADRVIAVDCNESNQTKDMRRLGSFLMSTLNSIIVNNTRQALKSADFIVHPQVDNVSGMDWQAADKLITAGYRAVAAQGQRLKPLALAEADWQEYLQQRAARKRSGVQIPQYLEVRGANAAGRRRIEGALQSLVGQPLEPVELERLLTEVMGSGFYESIRYDLQTKGERLGLVVTVTEKSYGPPFFGFTIEAVGGEGWSDHKLWTRATAFDIWGESSELRVDLGIGNYPALYAELYKPVINQSWFIAPRFGLEQTRSSFYQEDKRTSDFATKEQTLGLDLGYSLSRFAEIRLGYQLWRQEPDVFVGNAVPDLQDADGFGKKVGLKFSYSKAEDKSLLKPRTDWELTADRYSEAPLAEAGFSMAESKLRLVRRLGDRSLWLFRGAAGVTLDGQTPFLQQYTLGGPFRLGTYQIDEFRGENYWLGTFGLLTPLGGGSIRDRLFAGIFLENGATFADWSAAEPETTLTLGLAYPGLLGTFCLGVSFGDDDQVGYHLTIGQPF